ncbi:MAG: DUF4388 domain-containing protein [Anaerolineae bacterium]|nr:DUF4388 domain-containing protein [Anaerolineae bacterium]
MGLRGNLEEIYIADLIQLNCQSGVQARLTANRDDQQIAVYFEDGQIVHAQAGRVTGNDAVYALVAWDSGTFEVEQNVVAPERTITMPWSALVMEGLRRLDESREAKSSEEGKESEMAESQTRSERLKTTLRQLVDSSSDIQGVAVISMDGLIMAAALPQGLEQMRVGAVSAGIMSLSGRSVGQLGRGNLQLTLVQGTDGYVLLTPAGSNAAFVALTGANVNLGMVFLEVREGAEAVAQILG